MDFRCVGPRNDHSKVSMEPTSSDFQTKAKQQYVFLTTLWFSTEIYWISEILIVLIPRSPYSQDFRKKYWNSAGQVLKFLGNSVTISNFQMFHVLEEALVRRATSMLPLGMTSSDTSSRSWLMTAMLSPKCLFVGAEAICLITSMHATRLHLWSRYSRERAL